MSNAYPNKLPALVLARYDRMLSILFMLCWLLFFYLIQLVNSNDGFLVGFFVPDGVSHSKAVFDFLEDEVSFFSIPSTHYGMYFLYAPFALLSKKLIFFPNVLLLISSALILRRVLSRFGFNVSLIVCLIVFFNPYFSLIFTSVNKEIPLTFLISCYLFFLLKFTWKGVFASVLIAGVCFFFRDGYFFILIWISAFFSFFKFRTRVPVLLSVFLSSCLILGYGFLVENVGAVQRNVQSTFNSHTDRGGDASSLVEKNSLSGYYYRVAANAFAMSVRPVFITDEYKVSLLGIGYLLMGVFICFSYLLSLFVMLCLWRESCFLVRFSSSFLIIALFLVSFSLYVQPRYLFPFFPLMLFLYTSVIGKYGVGWMFVVGVVFTIIIFFVNLCFYWIGFHPPLSVVVPVYPEFIF